jgi:ribosomal protein S18 acetylase RimI-like enzyme
VAYNDPLLWGEKDKNDAIYLHRIATHPQYKGKQLIRNVIEWSHVHARSLNRKFIRMDTWADNDQLRDYYINAGFTLMGKQFIEKNQSLPMHYWGIYLNLFQMEVSAPRDHSPFH